MTSFEHSLILVTGFHVSRFTPQMSNQNQRGSVEPFLVNQIAQSLFGERFIIIYDNTIQFHNHCYHVKRIGDVGHRYSDCYYLQDANTGLAMRSDIDFAAPGSYGAIFDPTTGTIVGYDETSAG